MLKLRISEAVVEKHGDVKGALMHILDVLSMYEGDRDVLIYLPDGRKIKADSGHRVEMSDELKTRLINILGEENVKG